MWSWSEQIDNVYSNVRVKSSVLMYSCVCLEIRYF